MLLPPIKYPTRNSSAGLKAIAIKPYGITCALNSAAMGAAPSPKSGMKNKAVPDTLTRQVCNAAVAANSSNPKENP